MKFFPLYETAAGSGIYALSGSEIEAGSTSEALATAQNGAPSGCRTGVWPYRSISGVPDMVEPLADENGKTYSTVAQADGASAEFSPSGQILASAGADASGLCLSLQNFFGYRIGLVPTDAKPAGAATSPSASGSGTTGG